MSTPNKTIPLQDPAAVTESPGTWRHPRLNEINRRREATTFSEKNARRIAYNAMALLCLWTVQLLVKMYASPKSGLTQHHSLSPTFRLYLGWVWTLIQLIPLLQIISACLPLFRARDELTDIPLTAAQRRLLGLAPVAPPTSPLQPFSPSSSSPAPASSPASQDLKFSTPPRYSRTPSIAGSVGSRGSHSHSPLSGRGASPAAPVFQSSGGGGSRTGSPFSPAAETTPLRMLQKNISVLGDSYRRSSFSGSGGSGAGSPFSGSSTAVNLLGDPVSPSPAGGKRTSVGLNSKWLYEKGRRSSGSAWVH